MLYEVERLLNTSALNNELPKYLLLENVRNLVNKRFKTDFDKWLQKLESLGYTNYWQILNSKDYGLPQNRERVFCVSILGDKHFEFPKKQELKLKLKDLLENEVDKKYYLSEELAKSIIVKINDFSISVKNATAIGYADAIEGDSVNLAYPTSKTRRGRVGKQISQTLVTQDSMGVVVSGLKIRKLTPKECWRLMGWEDKQFDMIKGINETQLYKQAGNAIVIKVLEAIFANMFQIENKKEELL